MPLVKLTGGQRIDLVGMQKEDLPGVWRDLGMPAGYAWGKSYRTCKSCIGIDYLPLRPGRQHGAGAARSSGASGASTARAS